jgi:hypothetical protein
MGLNDAQEMLDAALADALVYEGQIATLTEQVARIAHRIAAVRRLIATETISLQDPEDASYDVVEVWRLEQILDEPASDEHGSST